MELIQVFKKLFKIGMFNPKNFGFYGKQIGISTDTLITKPVNVYLYGNNGLKRAVILSNSAKFIMKKTPEHRMVCMCQQEIMRGLLELHIG